MVLTDAAVSSLAYSISQMLLALVSMNSQFDGDKYAFSPCVPSSSFDRGHSSVLNPCSRTALQTVLLALALLCAMGCVCSLTTRSLHKIVMWFAPINGSSVVRLLCAGLTPSNQCSLRSVSASRC